jgi:two-component system chemotaxis response regulator CheB
MHAQDIIVIGGSAGSLEPLSKILQGLRRSLPAAVFVAVHTAPQGEGALPTILERNGPLPACFPTNGDPIRHSQIYVAPPDHHLLTNSEKITVMRGPRENGFRPAIDPLFRSAAQDFDGRVVGVLLSGGMDDGTFGLMSIKAAGGIAIVQHPYEALVPNMPLRAIQNVEVDHIVPAVEIAGLVTKAAEEGLARKPLSPAASRARGDDNTTERDIHLQSVKLDSVKKSPSRFSCPECGGTLWELEEGGQFRFRCHTGHGFTPDTLLVQQNGEVEHALWSALRILKERAALHRQLAERTDKRGMSSTAEKFLQKAHEEEAKAEAIRQVLNTALESLETAPGGLSLPIPPPIPSPEGGD